MAKGKSSIKAYDDLLRRHFAKKDFVQINRTFYGKKKNISGFILAISKDFLLIQNTNEFFFNGYLIIRKDGFDSIRCNEYDKTQKKIFKGEGILNNGYGLDKKISLENWQEIFRSLKAADFHVIIECEEKEEPDFEIGPIKRVNSQTVSIQYYNPAGILEIKTTSVRYADITTLTFGDRYTTIFKKYLK